MMLKSRLLRTGSILACVAFHCIPHGVSQIAAGALNGTVTDSTGASIPKATVAVGSSESGFQRHVITSEAGTYTIPDLLPGNYSLTVDAVGFKRAIVPKISLFVGQTSTQNFQLQVGSEEQEVTVSAQAPLLNTTNGQLGTVVTGTLMTQLPLNGRNVMQLNLLSPGAITDKGGNTSNAASLSPATVTFSVNGQQSDYNLYLLDGVQIKDWQHGTDMFNPSVDAIGEFQTTTSNYSAAYGSESAAQINLLVKAGTNTFHGTVFEYLRNDVLNARNFFQPVGSPAPFKRNQFGGNLGGPVRIPHLYNGTNKTFFFFNYEGFRQVKRVPETGYFPTQEQLSGDLSSLVTPATPLLNPFNGQPFAGNVIPSNMIRPATLEGFLGTGIGTGPWVPVQNASLAGVNYINNSPLTYFANQYIARIDQNISDKTLLYGHFAYNKDSKQDPNLNPNWFITEGSETYSAAGHLVHVFSPDIVGEIGGGYTHFFQNFVQSTAGKVDITNAILKIAGNATIPDSWGAPIWNVAGFNNMGETSAGPRLWFVNIIDLRPTATLTKGKHSLHVGLDFERVNEDFQEIFRTNGTWNYDGQFSGYSLADFLLGLPNTINSSPDPFSPNIWNSAFGPYFQDDWKITPNLTLNLGLRYEWVSVPFSHNHQSVSNVYFPPNNGVPELVIADTASAIKFRGVQATLFQGVPYVRASSVGLPKQLAFNDNGDISPRFGFAYRLPWSTSTVIRGGYGIFYGTDVQDNWVEAAVDPPFVRSNLTVLDSTNFAAFDPSDPYVNASASAAQVFGNQIKHHLGTTQEWNLTLEQTRWDTLFSVAYVGNDSTHLADLSDPNQAIPGPGDITARRQWPSTGVLYIGGTEGIGNYNALQTKAQHRYTNGLEFLASYTWSKTFDTSDGSFVGEGQSGFDTQNLLDPKSEYSLAAQHVGQAFTFSSVYDLPFGKNKRFVNHGGLASVVIGGWQVNGVTSVISGSPYTVSQGSNGANTDVGNFSPDQNGNPNTGPKTVAEFFNTAVFSVNSPTNGVYRFGSARRNAVIGPGTVDTDFSLYKNIPLGERGQLQFRTEFFNLFNHPIFGQPGVVFGTPSFGTLSSTAIDNREIQFALRASF